MAKYVLHNDANMFDFVLLGISSMDNQYVVINNINDHLGIDLVLNENMKIPFKNQNIFEFSVFSYADEELGLEYFLVPNKSNYQSTKHTRDNFDLFSESNQIFDETVLLINELPKTDYFLILKGDSAIHEQYKIFNFLKEIACINQVHEIIPDKLPSRGNLLF